MNEENKPENKLFLILDSVLAISLRKFYKEKASDSSRRAWARILIQGCAVYGKLFELNELEDLKKRVSILEGEKVGKDEIESDEVGSIEKHDGTETSPSPA